MNLLVLYNMMELIAEDHLTATGKERLDLKYDQGETITSSETRQRGAR